MADASGVHEEQVVIESDGGSLVGVFYAPPAPLAGALVFCNPIFEERKSAHRVMVEAARRVAARGLAVLRFDYRGCGDGTGAFDDFAPCDWLADIRRAHDWLTARTARGDAGFLGVRLGATLAAHAAAERSADAGGGAPPATALLWEPVVNGKSYVGAELRRSLVKDMLTFGEQRRSRTEVIAALEAGETIDFDGYPLSARLYRELCDLTLPPPSRPPPAPRILVLNVSPVETLARPLGALADDWRAAGAAVEARAIRCEPFWSLVGLANADAVIAATCDWLTGTA